MWLLPAFSGVSALAIRAFYRVRVAGERVPAEGPTLLVANHPNSLLDPAMVVAVAGRRVRFLAKAPLFDDPQVGWLVRGAGAIPVYRRADDESQMARNDDTFRAAHDALLRGDAVGIFPEGISHSEPALAPLKTGAARIALGAAARLGRAFPIVPLGLSLPEKGVFRSEALAVVGRPIAWDDVAAVGDDPVAVRALTRRIEQGLRDVTVNLERWEDAELVESVEAIHAAERGDDPDPARRVARVREVSELLARLRAEEGDDWVPLKRDVERHLRLLRRAGLRPHQLPGPRGGEVARWSLRNALYAAAVPVALTGAVLFFVPYQLTAALERRGTHTPDIRATYKLLMGGALHLGWWLLVSLAAFAGLGVGAGVAVLLGMPLAGVAALAVFDRLRLAEGEASRFVVRAAHPDHLERLRADQRDLAERLAELRERLGERQPPLRD